MAITGDIGDLMVQHRYHYDIFEWPGCKARDIRYFAEKVVTGYVEGYDGDLAREHLEAIDSDDCGYEKAKELLDDPYIDFGNPHETIQRIYDEGIFDGGDFPSFDNYDSNFLWCREAVVWFFKNWEGVGACSIKS